ncbi:MAG: hypothetical protein KAT65_07310, partial [Methanophagales archaeon]|nr:hypothetical protein [Methanophagales archaeon]
GIHTTRSSNNNIYLNNFTDNTDNANSYNSTNIWRSPSKMSYTYNGKSYKNYLGNYWSDYEGRDADGDGIGDDPYTMIKRLSKEDKDEYPLMKPWENYLAEEGRVGLLEKRTPSAKNLPPFSPTLTADKPEPQPAGTAITWTASATDPDGDNLYYRFWISGPANYCTTMREGLL